MTKKLQEKLRERLEVVLSGELQKNYLTKKTTQILGLHFVLGGRLRLLT